VLFEPGPDGFSPASPAAGSAFAAQNATYPSRLGKTETQGVSPSKVQRRRLVNAARDETEFYALYQSNLRKTREAEDLAGRSKQALSIDERQAALLQYVGCSTAQQKQRC
jgi:hypothetical protein